MKLMLFSVLLFCAHQAFAQKASVGDIPTDQSTTIKISKGESSDRDFDILSATAEIAGEPQTLAKAARDAWKKACNEWKAEMKEMNKDNQVLALNCNSPKCATEKSSTACVSQGSYQLKVRIKK